jgi:hypothetical protein
MAPLRYIRGDDIPRGSHETSGPLEDSRSDKRPASGAPLPRKTSEQKHGKYP